MLRLVSLLVVVVTMVGCATAVDTPVAVRRVVPEPPQDLPPPIDPDPVEEAYQSIALAVSLGNPQDAIAAYEAAKLNDPNDPETRVLLATLYVTAGEVDAAAEILNEVLAEDEEHANALFLRALMARASGNEDAGEELLRRVLAVEPEHAAAWAAYGELLLAQGNFETAESAFRASLQAEEDNLVALVGSGQLQLRAAAPDPKAAEDFLSRAIAVAPTYPFAYVDRSRARVMQLRLQEAESDLDRAIELDPDFIWHRYDRGTIRLQRNAMRAAIADFSWVVEQDSGIFLAYVYRARAYDALGERERATIDYREALRQRPNYAPAYGPLGVLLFELARYEEAAAIFDAAWTTSAPAEPVYPLLSALALKYAGLEREARDYIERAASSFPRPSVYWDMARYYISPAHEGRVMRTVNDEQEHLARLRGQFFLAAQMELLGRERSAGVLYHEILNADLPGFLVTRLAQFLAADQAVRD